MLIHRSLNKRSDTMGRIKSNKRCCAVCFSLFYSPEYINCSPEFFTLCASPPSPLNFLKAMLTLTTWLQCLRYFVKIFLIINAFQINVYNIFVMFSHFSSIFIFLELMFSDEIKRKTLNLIQHFSSARPPPPHRITCTLAWGQKSTLRLTSAHFLVSSFPAIVWSETSVF